VREARGMALTYVEQDLEDDSCKDGGARAEDRFARLVVSAVALSSEVAAVSSVDDDDELKFAYIGEFLVVGGSKQSKLTARREVAPITRPSACRARQYIIHINTRATHRTSHR
jgi:hypothetical protein